MAGTRVVAAGTKTAIARAVTPVNQVTQQVVKTATGAVKQIVAATPANQAQLKAVNLPQSPTKTQQVSANCV